MLTNIGLVVISVAWFYEIVSAKRDLKPAFPTMYAIGVACIATDAFLTGLTVVAWLNIAVLTLSIIAFLKSLTKKNSHLDLENN